MRDGIIAEDKSTQSKSIVLECSRCKLANSVDSKPCFSCGYSLPAQAFEEIKEIEIGRMCALGHNQEETYAFLKAMADIMITDADDKTRKKTAGQLIEKG